MRRKKLVISSFVTLIIICCIIFLKPILYHLNKFLTDTDRVTGNILIIEGWLPYDDLRFAIDEFYKSDAQYIFTTGLKSTPEYYNVNTDGYLIFYTGKKLSSLTQPGMHTIAVNAASELDGENSAHFNLWINDSIIADFYAGKRKRKYVAEWQGQLSHIDSVMVQFDNDIINDIGDRNLFVKELIFDKKVKIPFLNNSVYEISALRNRIVNNMNSNAEMTAKRLVSMGVDKSIVIAIPGERARINRTLTSAMAVRDWLKKNKLPVTGINIVSAGAHSRRTWMAFHRVLPFKVGIIALPDRKAKGPEDIRIRKTLRETIAFIYYWIILIPYSS